MVVPVVVSSVWYDVVYSHVLHDGAWHGYIGYDIVFRVLYNPTDISANISVKVLVSGLSRQFQLLQVKVLPMH